MLSWIFSQILPHDILGNNAGRGVFASNSWLNIIVAAAFLIPMIETMLAQLMPIEAMRFFKNEKNAAVLLSATIFSIGHFINGGMLHGALAIFTGLVLASLYISLRSQGIILSCAATTMAHGIHNLIILAVAFIFE